MFACETLLCLLDGCAHAHVWASFIAMLLVWFFVWDVVFLLLRGQTPLHLAARHYSPIFLPIVLVLVECGANAMLKDENGHTPSQVSSRASPLLSVFTRPGGPVVRWGGWMDGWMDG